MKRKRGAQPGTTNNLWKGDAASYAAKHSRVSRYRGTPPLCSHCGTTTARRFEWANLTGNYGNVNDYIRLCAPCHRRMDGNARHLIARNVRQRLPGNRLLNGRAKLSDAQVWEACRMPGTDEAAAAKFGVTRSTISRIRRLHRKANPHVY